MITFTNRPSAAALNAPLRSAVCDDSFAPSWRRVLDEFGNGAISNDSICVKIMLLFCNRYRTFRGFSFILVVNAIIWFRTVFPDFKRTTARRSLHHRLCAAPVAITWHCTYLIITDRSLTRRRDACGGGKRVLRHTHESVSFTFAPARRTDAATNRYYDNRCPSWMKKITKRLGK